MSEFLIQVSAVATGTTFSVTLKNYLNGQAIPTNTPMDVTPGDRIAWNLRVAAGGRLYAPSFTVQFFRRDGTTPDTSFFGQSTVAAPSAQTTQFLHVLALQELIKYSIVADGFGKVLDPHIQTGDGTDMTGHRPQADQVPSYTIIWYYPKPTITYQAGIGRELPFPPNGLSVKLGDEVAFIAAVDGPAPTDSLDATFDFDPNHFWLTPFTQGTQSLPITVPPANMRLFTVVDRKDKPGTVFSFHAENSDGSITSDTCKLILSD